LALTLTAHVLKVILRIESSSLTVTMTAEHPPQQPRDRVRRPACLDGDTHAKLEALAKVFHRKHAAILRYVMHWGLAYTQGQTWPRLPIRPWEMAWADLSPSEGRRLPSPMMPKFSQQKIPVWAMLPKSMARSSHSCPTSTCATSAAPWRNFRRKRLTEPPRQSSSGPSIGSARTPWIPPLTKEGSYETRLGFPRVAPVGAAHRLRRLSDTGAHGCGQASQGWWLFGVLRGTILNAELVRQRYA
jgi:hypothetical protein